MNKNTTRTLSTVAALSVLVTACTANTSPTESTGSSAAASTTGCQWNDPNAQPNYVPLAYCTDLVGDNTVSASGYSGDSCNSYTVEWNDTNEGGTAYTAILTPEPPTALTATTCAESAVSMTVYGLEVTVNAATRTDTVNWLPIATSTVGGTWNGSYCSFGSGYDTSLSFSMEIPGAAYPTIPSYQALKVVGQFTQTTPIIIIREGAPREEAVPEGLGFSTTSYLPFSVHLQSEFCTYGY